MLFRFLFCDGKWESRHPTLEHTLPDTNPQVATPGAEQTVNKPSLEIPLEYSSLPQVDSSPIEIQPEATEPSPPTSEQPREPYIPRERFDSVIAERNQYQAQLAQMQQMIALQNQQSTQQAQYYTGLQAPTQNQPQVDFSQTPQMTKEEAKQWQDRIANEGAPALIELIRQTVTPLGNQLVQQFNSQLSPLRQTFVNQTIGQYTAQKTNPQSPTYDPTFAQIQPYFNQALQNVLQQRPNIDLNPQALGMVEYVAKQQAQMNGISLDQPQALPFTERPGASTSMMTPQQQTLTAQEQQIARTFGMTPQEYLAYKGEIQ